MQCGLRVTHTISDQKRLVWIRTLSQIQTQNATFPVGFLNKQIPLNTMNSASDNSDFLTTASLHLGQDDI